MGYIIVGTIIGGIIWGIVVNKVIENKGYQENWFWWGFFFGIFALIVALTKQSVNTTKVVIESSAPIKENMELLSSYILNNQVNVSSPVHIASWEIKKDAERLVLFVNFINVSQKAISAVMFSATGFNSFGDRVQINGADLFDVIGQDLSIKPNEYGKVYTTLQDDAIRKVEIKVKKICFADGTIVDDIQDEWVNTNQFELNSIHIDCARRENVQSKFYAIIKERYWQCICGFVNPHNTCAICGMQKSKAVKFTQENFDNTYSDYLKQIESERINEERRRLEEEQIKEEQQARTKKNKKTAIISISLIVSIVLAVGAITNLFVLPLINYNKVLTYIENEQYDEALTVLESIKDYKDSSELRVECSYQVALNLIENGKDLEAMEYLQPIFEYKDSKKYIKECVDKYTKRISNQAFASFYVNDSGNVRCTRGYTTDNMSDVRRWSNIIEINSAPVYTVGLRANGTVVFHGTDTLYLKEAISEWKNIKKICAGDYHIVGIKEDGTVVSSIIPEFISIPGDQCSCDVSLWYDIIDVATNQEWIAGLRSDGTVVTTGTSGIKYPDRKLDVDVSNWSGITQISASAYSLFGLKSDGSVISSNKNIDLSPFKDIVSIHARSNNSIVGLKYDGTVIFDDGDSWNNIIAISASKFGIIGLKTDGSFVAIGDNDYGQCDVGDWYIKE